MKVKTKKIQNSNGVNIYKNVLVEDEKEYTIKGGNVKGSIMDQYTYAKQLNTIIDAILTGDNTKLQVLSDNINKLKEGV